MQVIDSEGYLKVKLIGGPAGPFVPYTGATSDVNIGTNDMYVNKLWLYDAVNDNYGSTHYSDGNYHIEDADGHKLLVIEDGFVQIHKTDTIQSNLYTSGLTVTRDHYLPDASGTIALTSDLSAYVPTSRTLTINGTTQDLSANRTFTISTGITIGTTAITSGTVGRVLFEGTGNVVSESANLFWDNVNGRLGIGTSTPLSPSHISGAISASSGLGINQLINGSITATANNNILTSLQVNSTYSASTFTGVNYFGLIVGSTAGRSLRFQRDTITVGPFQRNSINAYNGAGQDPLFIQDAHNGAVYIGNGGGEVQLNGSGKVFTGTGNFLVNTTTDAGFKLDVNGTARVSGLLTMVGNIIPSVTNTYALGVTGNRFTNLFCSGSIFGTSLRSSVISFGNESGTEYMRLFSTGNVAINTTTDAGFKLDVNGTARVSATDGATAFQITAPTRAWYFTTSAQGGTFNSISASPNGASGSGNFGYVVGGGWSFNIGTTTSQGNSLFGVYTSGANTGDIRIGGQTSVASSLLTMDSTTKGFLPPRMTTTQKNAIASPATGLMVYDTTLNKLCVFTTAWETVTSI